MLISQKDFPSCSDGKASCLQWGRPGFDPWVGKILWRRKWQPIPVLLPGKLHGWRSLLGYSPWGPKELDTTERLHFLSLELLTVHTYISRNFWKKWVPIFTLLLTSFSDLDKSSQHLKKVFFNSNCFLAQVRLRKVAVIVLSFLNWLAHRKLVQNVKIKKKCEGNNSQNKRRY